MSAHTPGPWSVSGVRRKWYQAEDIKHVCDSHAICTNDGEAIALVMYDPKQHLPCWNDARLIAAAPDLLEACGIAFDFLKARIEEFEGNPPDWFDAACEAAWVITRATDKATQP